MRASLSKRVLLLPVIMALMIGFLGMTPAVAAGSLVAPVPAVSGIAVVGKKLTAVPGKWTSGTVLKYQWQRSGVAISGATASSLTLGSADLGKKMSVRVTGSKAGYKSVVKASKATGAVAAGSLVAPVPTVSGIAVVGKKLSATPGTWTSGTVLKYQWLRSGVVVKGATASSLTLGSADMGKQMSVRVTGSKAGYKSVAKTSKVTAAVAAGALVAPVPTVSGSAVVGKKLSATPGTWTSGTVLKYQWLRSGVVVKGATASSLTLGSADRGKTMSVRVTGSKAGYKSVAKTSKATAVVAAPPSKVPSLSDPMVAESFKLINDYRAKNKLKALKWNPNLAIWSQKWADHLLVDCSSPSWAGNWHNQTFYNNYPAGWTGAGENVALNTSVKTMFDSWVNSSGHKANMLNPNFTDFGFGYASYTKGSYAGLSMGVQNFARY
ncbi:hypothetical protein ART_1304 [Arthrobacter sp. PAMC 25486]|uniref:CAP domain-containing protein n=1 Tax=Arthrobacter sp. PAMC 25486 TaxID=1494608 RepID=UPI000535C525|nr:CAP domain-containing protein [Arthrobacter sp. PAMC 25486]AIY00903.1 hypothetical protein ART_1304 [Arthrobacter sp. PAMC 25486]